MDDIINELKNKSANRMCTNHFAVIFRHNRLRWSEKLAFAMNSTVQQYGKCTTHAEENALDKYVYGGKKAKIDILVVRLTKNNVLGLARPCKKCVNLMSLIKSTGKAIIKDIYYSLNNGDIQKEKFCEFINSDKIHLSSGFCYKATCKLF
jgi:cytidine deaminase